MKLRFLIFHIIFMMSLLIGMTSCKPTIPSRYLQPDEMEDVLFDYHIADAMYKESRPNPETMLSYKAAILKKYGVTEAQFDSSMVYYTRHTRLLQAVYESLSTRLNKEAMAKGAATNDMIEFKQQSANGDTVNVWKENRTVVMLPYSPFNVMSFNIPIDSTFHAGDIFQLELDAQFVFQEGTRDAIALLKITFGNDSIATQYTKMSYPSHFTLRIEDSKKQGIKAINGYFLLNNAKFGAEAYSTTFKLMILSNISLIKMRATKTVEKSLSSLSDSIKIDHNKSNHTLSDTAHRNRHTLSTAKRLRKAYNPVAAPIK